MIYDKNSFDFGGFPTYCETFPTRSHTFATRKGKNNKDIVMPLQHTKSYSNAHHCNQTAKFYTFVYIRYIRKNKLKVFSLFFL